MVYLYLDNATIKLLALSKTMLGQYHVSAFTKKHSTQLLVDGHVHNVDILASAIKEAILSAQPHQIQEKSLTIILPQTSFSFLRQDVPLGTSEQAVIPMIKDRLRTEHMIDSDHSVLTFVRLQQQTEQKASMYALPKVEYEKFVQAAALAGMTLAKVLPDTISYFTLFRKTLREEKKELIFYLSQQSDGGIGYLFDSLGLREPNQQIFGSDPREQLKLFSDHIQNQGQKINRLILSGEMAPQVRQDLFTKETGIWTNPLEKIVQNFYLQYLKVLVPNEQDSVPYLAYDACFGAFIHDYEQNALSQPLDNHAVQHEEAPKPSLFGTKTTGKGPGFSAPSFGIKRRDIFIFLCSFIISFALIWGSSRLKMLPSFGNFAFLTQATPTPIPTTAPTASPIPTPVIDKAKLKVKVLNGEGTPGKAGEVATYLKARGYSDIVTANADSFDFKETVVRIQKDKKESLSGLVLADLADATVISPAKVEALEATETADIVIVMGADFKTEE